MRIGVTGSAGFIGRHLLQRLGEAGHTGVPLRHPAHMPIHLRANAIQRGALWRAELSVVDAVVHLANRAHAALPALAYQADVDDMEELLSAASACGTKRLVYLSSAKASDAVVAKSGYAAAKISMEQLLLSHDVPWTVLRPCLVHGPGMKGNFLRLIQAVRHRVPLPVRSLANERSMLSVEDLCAAIGRSLVESRALGQVLAVAHPRRMSSEEVVHAVAKGVGRAPILVPPPPLWLRDQLELSARGRSLTQALYTSMIVDSSKAAQMLGLAHEVDPFDSIARAAFATLRIDRKPPIIEETPP